MKYKGFVEKENIKDASFLNFTQILKEGNGKVIFECEDDIAPAVALEMSEEFHPGSHFGVVRNEEEVNIVFPQKVFTYTVRDSHTKEQMIKYGETLGISPKELEIF